MPAIIADIIEKTKEGINGSRIVRIRRENTKPNTAAKSVEKAIKPK
jgi:hypothetical protein